jgi:hypothetical protein
MEPLSSFAAAIGALLTLATAAINLAATIRSQPSRRRDRDQHNPTEDRRPPDGWSRMPSRSPAPSPNRTGKTGYWPT